MEEAFNVGFLFCCCLFLATRAVTGFVGSIMCGIGHCGHCVKALKRLGKGRGSEE